MMNKEIFESWDYYNDALNSSTKSDGSRVIAAAILVLAEILIGSYTAAVLAGQNQFGGKFLEDLGKSLKEK